MIPVGYMAKRITKRAEWLKAPQGLDVYSVSNCVNEDFLLTTWTTGSTTAGGCFDSPEVIRMLSRKHSIELQDTQLFYYEVYELEYDAGKWRSFSPWEDSWKDSRGVVEPCSKRLEGYDVVTFWVENSPAPEHSPLSCNSVACAIPTNSHCLFDTFDEAQTALNTGQFTGCEPGALRIFAVYSVDWPQETSSESVR